MNLDEISAGQSLAGIGQADVVTVVTGVSLGNGAIQLICRTPAGTIKERLLSRADEAAIALAVVERPFSFDGNAANSQLTCEAKRIDLALLFDPMMAVHTSNVDPLPHQITAVRILIVAPGSLVEQWRDEMLEKFGLEFFVYSSRTGVAERKSIRRPQSVHRPIGPARPQ